MCSLPIYKRHNMWACIMAQQFKPPFGVPDPILPCSFEWVLLLLRRQQRMTQALRSFTTHVGDSDGLLGSWLWPDSVSADVFGEWTSDWKIAVFFFPPPNKWTLRKKDTMAHILGPHHPHERYRWGSRHLASADSGFAVASTWGVSYQMKDICFLQPGTRASDWICHMH